MFRKKQITFAWAVTLLLGLVFEAPAAAQTQSAVIIGNGLDVKVSVRFKCYTDTSWETNTCPSTGGQALYIDAKKSHSKAYTHPPGCQNIYITFTRYDRSSASCTVEKRFGFNPGQPKLLTIRKTGQGFCDYTMDAMNATDLRQ